MAISTFKKTINIVEKLPHGTSNVLSLISEPLPLLNLPTELTVIATNLIVESLVLYVNINSLNISNFPDFDLEDSDTTKALKVAQIQRLSPRFDLELLIRKNKYSEWCNIHTISLLNTKGFPYRIYDLLSEIQSNFIQLNDLSNIGLRINNVGYGVLDTNDNVTIRGAFYQEYIVYSSDYVIASNGNNNNNNNTSVTWENITSNQWDNLTFNQWDNL